jgi:nucleotide-binding universal stress UspA family protein
MLLVPFRIHPAAESALKYAIQFSKQFDNLDIVCFHCTEKNETSAEDLNSLKNELQVVIQKTSKNSSIALEVVDGEYENQIRHFAEKNLVDAIIVGTRKVTGLQKTMHEGRTAKFLDNTTLPTLIIPEGYDYKPIEILIWASDYKEIKNDCAIDPLVAIALQYDAEVRIAHVRTDSKGLNREQFNEMHREEYLFSEGVKHSFKKIKGSTISNGLNYYLKLKGDNDVLVFVKRKHGFMDNLFKKNHSTDFTINPEIPILILHEEADSSSLKRT